MSPPEVAAGAASADAGAAAETPLPDACEPAEVRTVTGPGSPLAPGKPDAEEADAGTGDADADADLPADTEEADTEADLPADADADAVAPAAGLAIRRATAAVRLATRPTWRRITPADGAGVDVPAGLPAAGTAAAALGVVRRRAGLAGGCSGCARRMASARRSAVTGPGADSGDAGIALPVARAGPDNAGDVAWLLDACEGVTIRGPADGFQPADPAGEPCRAGPACSGAEGRTAAVALATDRRSVAATPAPLCWETAPALAARAGVESPLPVEFPGGADPEPVEDGGACLGARSRRCSCELVIGPAAVTSSIRRTGIAVDTRAPAMVPGERGWSSVGTCLAALARPRGGRAVLGGAAPESCCGSA